MCKRSLAVGVLLCSMSMGQAFGMDASLINLRDTLMVLARVLAGQQILPAPTTVPPLPPLQPPVVQTPPPAPVPPVPAPAMVVVPPITVTPVVNPVVVQIPVVVPTPPAPPTPPPHIAPKPVNPVKPVQPLKPAAPVVVQPTLGDITNAGQNQTTGDDIKSKLKNLLGVVDGGQKPNIKLGKQKQTVIQAKNYQLEITMAGNLPPYMDQLKSMPVLTAQQKADKKAFARAILNAILSWVQKKQVKPEVVEQAVQTLLQVDPLMISTAALVLQKVGFDQEYIRALMVQLFRKQVAFIEQRFIDEQASANITAGARDDIDEAVSYPMELLGATRLAENIKLMSERKSDATYVNADNFLKNIDQEKQRLCAAIQKNAHKFEMFPEYYAVYSLYCGKVDKKKVDVYCTTPNCTYGPGIKDVVTVQVNLNNAINDLLATIQTYNASNVGSERVMIMQGILGTLSDFNYFFSNPHFCTICLKNAIDATKNKDPRFESALNKISTFIADVAQKQNNRYLDHFVHDSMPAIQNVINRVALMNNNEVWEGYHKAKAHWSQFHTK